MYRIKMFRHGKYLTAESSSNGANVYWSDSMYGNTIWQFVEPEDMFPTVSQVPPEIKDQTFALIADGTNLYLNVYGSDTVVEERNVNVYSKEDVLALLETKDIEVLIVLGAGDMDNYVPQITRLLEQRC